MNLKYLIAGLLGCVTAMAFAEDAALEEIIVTAQRRAESLQEVPVSVTALTADMLESRGLNDLNQISAAAPSLQLGQDNNFSIRGAGTLAFAGTLDSSVATAVDEVNLGRKFLTGAIFNDVAQIEVLNGPQGLLFGRNSSAGLMNITTTRPKLDTFEGRTELEYDVRDSTPGHGKSIIGKGMLNLPVSAISALRLNATYANQDPVAKIKTVAGNPRVDETTTNYGLKAKYLLQPSEALSLYVIGDYNKEKGVGGIFDRTWRSLGAGSVNAAPIAKDGVTPGTENLEYGVSGNQYRDVKTGGLQAKLSYELANGYEVSNIAAWKFYKQEQNLDTDFTSSDGLDRNYTDANYRQYSNELRLAIPKSERINGQVGLYFFDLKLDQNNDRIGGSYLTPAQKLGYPYCVGATAVPGANPPTCSTSHTYVLGQDNSYTLTNQSIAGFGQFDFNLTERFKLIAGARYTRDKIGVDINLNKRDYFTAFGGRNITRSESDTKGNVSAKLGVQYTVSPDFMSYLTLARGYKGPGYNDSPARQTATILVNPETVNSIEAGIKSSWFERRMIFNVSLFHQLFKDYQVQSFDPALVSFTVQNAAEVKSQGAELSIEARPVSALTFNWAATVLDSKFKEFKGAQCYPTQPTVAAGGNCSATSNGTFDASGYQTPQSAKFTSTLQGKYEFGISDGVQGFVGADYYYRSAINSNIARPAVTEIGSVGLWGFQVGTVLDSGWKFALFCKNCTDKKVPTAIGIDAADSSNRNNRGQAAPILSTNQTWGFNSVRNIGLTASYKF